MKESQPPLELHQRLAILMLRVLHFPQDDVADLLHHSKLTVKTVEDWFGEVPLREAQIICNDQSLKEKAEKIIVKLEDIDKQAAMRVAKISPEDILQHYRATEYLESKALEQEGIEPAVASNLERHFDDLAQTAKVLAHRIKVLLQHKDKYSNLEKMGNLIMEDVFQSKGTGVLFLGPMDIHPLEEYRYDRESAVDPYLAKCLLFHYLSQFGKLPYAGWEELKIDSTSEKIRNNLLVLAHSENLQFCPNCPSCKAIMG